MHFIPLVIQNATLEANFFLPHMFIMQCIYHNFQDNQPSIPDLGITPFVFYPSNAAIFTI